MGRVRILFTYKRWGIAHFGVLIGIYGRTVGTVLTAGLAAVATVAVIITMLIITVVAVALAAVALAAELVAVLSMRWGWMI